MVLLNVNAFQKMEKLQHPGLGEQRLTQGCAGHRNSVGGTEAFLKHPTKVQEKGSLGFILFASHSKH